MAGRQVDLLFVFQSYDGEVLITNAAKNILEEEDDLKRPGDLTLRARISCLTLGVNGYPLAEDFID